MANPETAQVSSLPLPPVQYYNIFTEENVRSKRVPRPPPIPAHESYTMFGSNFNSDDAIIRPLESQGIRRLYPQHCDRRKELRKLNHSLLVNFLDLIDLLVLCPDSQRREEKVEDLSMLFIHIHHLLNEFRPHQARESLRVMLDLQRRQRTETTERFKKHLEKAKDMVNTAIQQMPDCSESESKLLINTEIAEQKEGLRTDEGDIDPSVELDRQMCDIIDQL